MTMIASPASRARRARKSARFAIGTRVAQCGA